MPTGHNMVRGARVSRVFPAIFLSGLIVLLSACAVGPDFRPPAAPAPLRYGELPLPEKTAGTEPGGQGGEIGPAGALAAQRFSPEAPLARWWEGFGSPKAEALVARALNASPDLARAEAALVRAGELWRAEAGHIYAPALDASTAASRQQINVANMGGAKNMAGVFGGGAAGAAMGGATPGGSAGAGTLNPFALYGANLSVSYTFDFFGGGRRTLEALAAQIDVAAYQRDAARQAIAANVLTAAVREAGTRALIEATRKMIATRERQVRVAEAQLRAGGVSRLDLSTLRRELADLSATLPPLDRTLAAHRHRLAVLVGSLPSDANLPAFTFADFTLPRTVPTGVPGDLVRRRPDVQAAEALLHKATAEVGVAAANLYPRITLTGNAGYSANKGNELFMDSASVWNIGLNLLQPLFRGGELLARKRAAEAGVEEAAAAWRQTVLTAYAHVADALAALESGARTLTFAAEASTEARRVFELSRTRYQAGGISLLEFLDAERKAQQLLLGDIQARSDRLAQTVALYLALSGAPGGSVGGIMVSGAAGGPSGGGNGRGGNGRRERTMIPKTPAESGETTEGAGIKPFSFESTHSFRQPNWEFQRASRTERRARVPDLWPGPLAAGGNVTFGQLQNEFAPGESDDPPEKTVRGRLAPSPTGLLHLGNAFAFLLAWLSARSRGGGLILRLEDIDPERSRPAFARAILEDLDRLGLWTDEGPETGGPCAPYEQSRRLERYAAILEDLRRQGLLYPCYCTRKELRMLASAPHVGDEGAPYPGTCRCLTAAERAAREAESRRPCWRLNAGAVVERALATAERSEREGEGGLFPENGAALFHFTDVVAGPRQGSIEECGGDFALCRSDGVIAYQLAVVADDAAMGVTEVLRGEDLLASTPRQLLLLRLLGAPAPRYAHIPLLRDAAGERLAKRHKGLALESLLAAGVRPEAITGYLGHLAGLLPEPAPARPEALLRYFSERTLPALAGRFLRVPEDIAEQLRRLSR